MPDKMVEAYEEFMDANPEAEPGQIFAAAWSQSAVSMRSRAVKIAQTHTDRNDVINGIGSLPDIPTE